MFLNSRKNSWPFLIFSWMKSIAGGHICKYLCLNSPALFNSINLHLHEISETQSHEHTLDFVIFQNFYFSKVFGNIVFPLPFTTIPHPLLNWISDLMKTPKPLINWLFSYNYFYRFTRTFLVSLSPHFIANHMLNMSQHCFYWNQ